MVHGGPGNALLSIQPDFGRFASEYTVIYYDQRGNGRSDPVQDPAQLALDRHISDLDAIRAHFGLRRMNLLGNSWGGLLAAAYAGAHPERIARLVLHSPAEPTKALLVAAADEMERRLKKLYSAAEQERFARLSSPRYRLRASDPVAACREWAAMLIPLMMAQPSNAGRVRGDICSGSAEAVRVQQIVNMQIWTSLGDYDLRPAMAAVKAPVLVVYGLADTIPVSSAEAWSRAFPNARLLRVSNAGHVPQVERPDVFFPAVESFLAGKWPPGAETVNRVDR